MPLLQVPIQASHSGSPAPDPTWLQPRNVEDSVTTLTCIIPAEVNTLDRPPTRPTRAKDDSPDFLPPKGKSRALSDKLEPVLRESQEAIVPVILGPKNSGRVGRCQAYEHISWT